MAAAVVLSVRFPGDADREPAFDWYTIMPPALTELTSNAVRR
jgi:hypothetical protein